MRINLSAQPDRKPSALRFLGQNEATTYPIPVAFFVS